MPTHSTGCATCRKRKIRCDEGRPGCTRCQTHGVSCPGYRTEKLGGVEFKDQTIYTARRAEKHYKAKTKSQNADRSPPLVDVGSLQWMMPSPVSDDNIAQPIDIDFTQFQSLTLANDKYGHVMMRYCTPPLSPPRFFSPNLERTQLYTEFVTTYLPRVQAGAQNGHFSFFQALALNRSNHPALQYGMDAISLVQLGSLHKDQSLIKQAVGQYGRALSSLAKSISKGDFLYDDDVLAAVTVLATCELYEEIAQTGEGWGKHVEGSNRLVAARGPGSIKSEMALLLYSNMRHGSLLHAFISRTAPFLATPEWREVAFLVPKAAQDASTTFYDTAIQVPGLLQRHDELDLDHPRALETIDAILNDSSSLESQLRSWFSGWHAGAFSSSGQALYELAPIDDFRTFVSLCSDRTFTHAYMFPDFLIAYLHSLYWMTMHYLRTNTQSLHKHRHRLLPDWYPEASKVVPEDELLGYCLDLCRCIPFFVEPISSSCGSIGIFLPLRCAVLYFSAHGQWDWLKWLGIVKNSVFVKGLAPPNIGPESGKVSPGR